MEPETMIEAADMGNTWMNAERSSSIPDSPLDMAPVQRMANAVMEQITIVSKKTSNAPHTPCWNG